MNESKVSLLIVEDDEVDRLAMLRKMDAKKTGFSVTTVASVREAREWLESNSCDAIVSDHRLPDGTAFDVIKNGVHPVAILVTGSGDEKIAARAIREGFLDYVIKDVDRSYLEELPHRIEYALRLRRAELDLRQTNARLLDIFNNTPDFIVSLSTTGEILFANQSWCDTFTNEIKGSKKPSIFECMGPASAITFNQILSSLNADLVLPPFELTLFTRYGGQIVAHGRATLNHAPNGLTFIQVIFRDITHIKTVENRLTEMATQLEKCVEERGRELAESELRFRQMAETINAVFWMKDMQTMNFVYVSPAYELIWQHPASMLLWNSREWLRPIHPEDRNMVLEQIMDPGRSHFDIEYRLLRPDGSIRWIHEKGFLIEGETSPKRKMVGLATDITDKKELYEQMLQIQRMEGIGTLAAGIGHDLNNILTPILLGLDLLHGQHRDDQDAKLIQSMRESAAHGRDVVRNLITFARGGTSEKQPFQIRHLITGIANVIRISFPSYIRLEILCPDRLPPINGDATQIKQLLLNLCINARDAMPEGGTIYINVELKNLQTRIRKALPESRTGTFIEISVKDTGCGISEEFLAKIFDPFFSTKTPDRGSGLGLSSVLGIVKGHAGFICVDSTPGSGTNFTAYLPVTKDEDIEEPLPALQSTAETQPKDLSGCKILFIDDDPIICKLAYEMLSSHKLLVFIAENAAQAIKKLRRIGSSLDSVILDCNLPDMDAIGLLGTARILAPQAKFIALSGFFTDELKKRLHQNQVALFIRKPFEIQDLIAALR